jgi:hypothetical protein
LNPPKSPELGLSKSDGRMAFSRRGRCGYPGLPGLVNIKKNYGKSPFLMGKLTISMAIFSIAM